jgi:hypothetical protein
MTETKCSFLDRSIPRLSFSSNRMLGWHHLSHFDNGPTISHPVSRQKGTGAVAIYEDPVATLGAEILKSYLGSGPSRLYGETQAMYYHQWRLRWVTKYFVLKAFTDNYRMAKCLWVGATPGITIWPTVKEQKWGKLNYVAEVNDIFSAETLRRRVLAVMHIEWPSPSLLKIIVRTSRDSSVPETASHWQLCLVTKQLFVPKHGERFGKPKIFWVHPRLLTKMASILVRLNMFRNVVLFRNESLVPKCSRCETYRHYGTCHSYWTDPHSGTCHS